MHDLLCFHGNRLQPGLNLFKSGLQFASQLTLKIDLRHLKEETNNAINVAINGLIPRLDLEKKKIQTWSPSWG